MYINVLESSHTSRLKLDVPIEFRFNDSNKLQEHSPQTAKALIDIVQWMARRHNFTYSII